MRTAIVTGGARGIGRAVALALADRGHAVCVVDSGVALDGTGATDGPARRVAEEIVSFGGRALAVAEDPRTPERARAVVEEVGAWAGESPLVLVHAAGTLRDAMIHKATDDDWAEVLGSHLGVAVELTRALAGPVRQARWGRIVYVGGAAGLVGSVGQAAYDVAKAGLFGLTRAVALEMAGRDVCVNYLAPFAYTRMTESIPPVDEVLRAYRETAAGAVPADVAPLVAWLCSADAAGVTGQVFGARGASVTLWSQPRPVTEILQPAGFDHPTLTERLIPLVEDKGTGLQGEFDLFGGPPVPVRARPPGRAPEPTVEEPFTGVVADADAARALGHDYVQAVGKVIASHVRNELAGASIYDEPAIAMAPDPAEKWLTCRIAMEEYGHHLKFSKLARQLRLPDPLDRAPLSVFDYELGSWTDFVVLKAIVDLAEVILMEDLDHCTYLPLRRLSEALGPEERFHVSFGRVRSKALAADPATRAGVQQAVDELVRFTLPFFGRSTSANNAEFRRWGIKRLTNDECRARFIDRSRRFVVGELGLEFPDVPVAWEG